MSRLIQLLQRLAIAIAAPPFLQPLDRWLLLSAPIVWRARAHHVAWQALIIGNVLMLALGIFYPAARDGVPTIGEIANAFTAIQIFGTMGLSYWAFLLFRTPMGEQRPQTHLLTVGLYAFCMFCVLTVPRTFVAAASSRIAAVVPDDGFDGEYAFHAVHRFWVSYPELTEELAAQHRTAIHSSLERYGFRPKFDCAFSELEIPSHDKRDIPCLVFTTKNGALAIELFRDRVESVRSAKDFWKGSGSLFTIYVLSLPFTLLRSILVGGILAVALIPKHVWTRSFAPLASDIALPRVSLWRPAFVKRLDHFLLTTKPLVWSARLHTFYFGAFLYAVVSAVALVVIAQAILGAWNVVDLAFSHLMALPDLAAVMGIVGIGIALGGIWAVGPLRTPVRAKSIRQNLALVGLYFAGSLPFPLILIAFKSHEQAPTLFFLFIGISYLTSAVYLLKYVPVAPVAISFAGTLAYLVAVVLFDNKLVVGWLAGTSTALWIALACISTRIRMKAAATAALASVVFMLIPALTINLVILMWILGSNTNELVLIYILVGVGLDFSVAIPVMRTLIWYRSAPKP